MRGREGKKLTPPGKQLGVSRALLVWEPWCSVIVDGAKTWEIRGENTRKRERIANVRLRGANGEWQPCGKLAHSPTLPANVDKQCINYLNAIPYQEASAWALSDAQKYTTPRPYEHKPGCIKWIKLSIPVLWQRVAHRHYVGATFGSDSPSVPSSPVIAASPIPATST